VATKISLNTSKIALHQITKSQAHEVKTMYNQLAKNVQKQLVGLQGLDSATASLQTLKLKALQENIKQQVTNLSARIESVTKGNMETVAKAVVNDNNAWLKKAGMDTTASMLNVPGDVVESIATGKVYGKDWRLSDALWETSDKTRSDIDKVVAMGTAQGKSSYDIAKDLEKYVNPSAKKDLKWSKVYPGTNKVVDYNAQRLSRTMVGHAYDQSVITTSKPNPFVTGIQWSSAHAIGRTCALCNSRDGVIYDKSEVPMDHPNGLCTLIPCVKDDMSDVASRIGDWYNGANDPALDKFADFLEHGNDVKANVTKGVKAAIAKNTPKVVKSTMPSFQELQKVYKATSSSVPTTTTTSTIETKANIPTTVAVESTKTEDIAAIYDKMLLENNSLEMTTFQNNDYPTKFYDQFKKWNDSLSESESAGINRYTGGAYSDMNRHLRGIEKTDNTGIKKAMKESKSALSKANMDEDVIVRRGSDTGSLIGLAGKYDERKAAEVSSEEWLKNNYKSLIGKGAKDEGFMSTSPLSSGGFSASGVEYRIKVPKGAEAMYIAPISGYKSEQEILLNAGTRFVIRDIKYSPDNGRVPFTVYLEVLLKK